MQLDADDIWNTVIASYFGKVPAERLVRHQLESYNEFVGHQLEQTVRMFNPTQIHLDSEYNPETQSYPLEISISFENIGLHRPQIHENNGAVKLMMPNEARLRNFTYTSNMTFDVHVTYVVNGGAPVTNVLPNVTFGKMPIMLKSTACSLQQQKHVPCAVLGECDNDTGGYFVVTGSEKVVIGQECDAFNRVYCYKGSKSKSVGSETWTAEVKSVPISKRISPKQTKMTIVAKASASGNPITVVIPRIRKPVPLFVLFRYMGVLSDFDICAVILGDVHAPKNAHYLRCLVASAMDAQQCLTQEDAFKWLMADVVFTNKKDEHPSAAALRKTQFTKDVLDDDFYPHTGGVEFKRIYLGYVAKRLLMAYFGEIPEDDRDAYDNKRVDLTGTSINNIFRNYFNTMVKDMERQIIKEMKTGSWKTTNDYTNIVNASNISKFIKSLTVENGIKRALSTGDFGIKNISSTNSKVGVAQVLNRLNYFAGLSHMRRVSKPIEKCGKMTKPRKLHGSSWGFICPMETPEGQSVGIVKNMSLMTHITVQGNCEHLFDVVRPLVVCVTKLEFADIGDRVKVIVNGTWFGVTDAPLALYNTLKAHKRSGLISVYASVIFDTKMLEIRVNNDSGRYMRPLFIVRDQRLLITRDILDRLRLGELVWDDLLTNMKIDEAVVEYIDSEEQSRSLIAMFERDLSAADAATKYTHCEIHPSTIFGVMGVRIPFPDHNQSPRNAYQCAQGKQAIGRSVSLAAENGRMDCTSYSLNYPNRPLVETRISSILNFHEMPSGCNVTIAIMSFTGYNQEDSVLVNRGALERGLFQACIRNTEKDEDKMKVNCDEEIRCKPNPAKTRKMRMACYDKLGADGVVPPNTRVGNRDVIIGKVVPVSNDNPNEADMFEDHSKALHTSEETYIDRNVVDRNGDGYTFAKVRTRALRQPVIGDKFSNSCGQKGTAGLLIPESEMPYMEDGSVPDIIINPHAHPSRMTISYFNESGMGSLCSVLGYIADGTSYSTNADTMMNVVAQLAKCGMSRTGDQVMYNPTTGEAFEADVYVGQMYYNRLKHMVADKEQARAKGMMVKQTHQPTVGKARAGGLRCGEMERDVLGSHGATAMMMDRMFYNSDKYQMHVCRLCGKIAAVNFEKGISRCRVCDNYSDFALVRVPYACKLLFQELACMMVNTRIIPQWGQRVAPVKLLT